MADQPSSQTRPARATYRPRRNFYKKKPYKAHQSETIQRVLNSEIEASAQHVDGPKEEQHQESAPTTDGDEGLKTLIQSMRSNAPQTAMNSTNEQVKNTGSQQFKELSTTAERRQDIDHLFDRVRKNNGFTSMANGIDNQANTHEKGDTREKEATLGAHQHFIPPPSSSLRHPLPRPPPNTPTPAPRAPSGGLEKAIVESLSTTFDFVVPLHATPRADSLILFKAGAQPPDRMHALIDAMNAELHIAMQYVQFGSSGYMNPNINDWKEEFLEKLVLEVSPRLADLLAAVARGAKAGMVEHGAGVRNWVGGRR